jgi:hypothetical protein
LTFVFDENVPPGAVAGLTQSGEPAKHCTECLPRGAKDEEIFTFLGDRQWYFVSADLKISRKPHQTAALLAAGIGAFFFTGRAQRDPLAWLQLVVRRWPDIRAYAAANRAPFLCGVPDRGVLRRLKLK